MKNAFDLSFIDEDAESAHRDVCEKSKEKAKKERNKKKSKTDKESAENADSSVEWEHMTKRIMSCSEDHLDDSRSRSWVFKKWKCHVCSDYHLYRKCYYLFSSLAHEDWILRTEIKKMMKKALNENKEREKQEKVKKW